jgi:ribosomal protein L37AE/L43A
VNCLLGCIITGQHQRADHRDGCTGCLPRDADYGQLCFACVGRIRRELRDLPLLYRLLGGFLEPGRNGGDGRSGSREAPLPVNPEVLSLRQQGGILGVLSTWEADWREIRGDAPAQFRGEIPAQYRGESLRNLTEVVNWLEGHLNWAAAKHPAIDDFSWEVNWLWQVARRACQLIDHPLVADAPCIDCGGKLTKHYREKTGLDQKWGCETCHRTFDDAGYARAVGQMSDGEPCTAKTLAKELNIPIGRIYRWATSGTVQVVELVEGIQMFDPAQVRLAQFRRYQQLA